MLTVGSTTGVISQQLTDLVAPDYKMLHRAKQAMSQFQSFKGQNKVSEPYQAHHSYYAKARRISVDFKFLPPMWFVLLWNIFPTDTHFLDFH